MTKILLLKSFVFLVFFTAHAQQRFEVGVEGGAMNCYYLIKETQNNLANVPCIGGFGGGNFRFNTKKKFFLEAAVFFSEYTVGLRLKQETGYSAGNYDDVVFMSFRLGYPVVISKNLAFVPSIGVTPSLKILSGDGGTGSFEEGTSSGILRYDYKFRELGKNFYVLLNGSAAAEWKFIRWLKASAGVTYYHGISQIGIADIQYKIYNAPQQTAQLISKGSFLAFTFGLKYLLR